MSKESRNQVEAEVIAAVLAAAIIVCANPAPASTPEVPIEVLNTQQL